MKTIYTLIISLILTTGIIAQAPYRFSYQAVIRNTANELVTNRQVGMQISILQGSATGTPVYTETHSPTTNANGLVSIEIGGGTTTDDFSIIDWSTGPYFLQTETDPTGGTNYSITAVSQLLSVPYALFAQQAGSATIAGDEPLFEYWDKDWHDDVMVKFDQTIDGRKFFKKTISANGLGLPYTFGFDSAYVADSASYIGFGHSGYSEDYIGYKNNRFYFLDSPGGGDVNDPDVVVGGKIGIGVEYPQEKLEVDGTIRSLAGGFKFPDGSIQTSATYLNYDSLFNKPDILTHPNILIGKGAGENASPISRIIAIGDSALANNSKNASEYNHGTCNHAIGNRALYANTTGYNNIAFGSSALKSNISGNANTAIGHATLAVNTEGDNNVAIGSDALFFNKTGYSNTAIGKSSLTRNNDGSNNTALGYFSLLFMVSGNDNTAVGSCALLHNQGNSNTAHGTSALANNLEGNNNTAVGSQALWQNQYGSSNTAIGTQALCYNKNNSNLVAIGDSALFYNGFAGSESPYSICNTGVGSKALFSNTKGYNNSSFGFKSLYSNSTGADNTAIGFKSLYSNTTGHKNTASGLETLSSNTTGYMNTASGNAALKNNTEGHRNTANGYLALLYNTTGSYNSGFGQQALYANTTGLYNTAAGFRSLHSNTTGSSNVAIGDYALFGNKTISHLVAIGDSALYNNGTGASSNIHGTSNTAVGSKSLFSNSTGYQNTAFGTKAMYSNTTGHSNVAIGTVSLFANTNGWGNTAIGFWTLDHNTSGNANFAGGLGAMRLNSTGKRNVATGLHSLSSNQTGNSNVAIGAYSLYSNTNRSNVVAIGDSALYNNGRGATQDFHASGNTAMGSKALYSNTTGSSNSANGYLALYSNTTGFFNTATGHQALYFNNEGYNNTATGRHSLFRNTTGYANTAIAPGALYSNTTGHGNTANGFWALYHNKTGTYNTAVGLDAGPDVGYDNLSNTGVLGYDTKVYSSNTIRIGNSSITSIGGYTGWSNLSDGRFKTHVQNNVPGLEFVLKLRPVTFSWDMDKLDAFTGTSNSIYSQCPEMKKARNEKKNNVYTGFIAQEVEEAANAVGYDFSAIIKPKNEKAQYNLSYAEFVVPLVKAVQEQQETIEKQEALIKELITRIEALENK